MSLEMPERPSRPLFLFSISSVFAGGEAFGSFEKGENPGVQVAAAGPHDEAFDRRESHGRIDRAPVVHRAKR